MKELFDELIELLDKGEEAALATIIASSGSTPRGAGSRMLVRKDGTIRGTVGGGAVVYKPTGWGLPGTGRTDTGRPFAGRGQLAGSGCNG